MQSNIEQYANQLIPINTNLGSYVSHIISYTLILGAILVLLYLVWGGIQWIMSQGSKDKVQEAKDKITNAIIGLVVLASSWAVFLLLNHFFGLGINTSTSHSSSHKPSTTTPLCSSAPPTATVCYGKPFNFVIDNNWQGSCGSPKKENVSYRLVCRPTTNNNCAAVCIPK